MDHINHFAGVDIDQQHIVIIPNPLIRAVGRREAVGPGIVDEEARLEEQAVEEEADVHPAVAVGSERGKIRAWAEQELVAAPPIVPAKAPVAPPAAVPAVEVAIVPARTAVPAPAPVIPPPAAPIIAPAVAAAIAPPVTAPIVDPARIACDVSHLLAEPAAPTPVKAAVPAIITPASVEPVITAITAILDPVSAAVTAVFDPVGPAITAPLDLIGPDLATAVNPRGGTIAAALFEAVRPDIAALFDPVGADIAPAVNPVSAHFAPAINAVSAAFEASGAGIAAALAAFCGLSAPGDLAAKPATGRSAGTRIGAHRGHRNRSRARCRFIARCRRRSAGRIDTRGARCSDPFGTRGGRRALHLHAGRAAAHFAAHRRSICAGRSACFGAGAAPVLCFSGGGGQSKRERSGQRRERTAPCKQSPHSSCLLGRQPTTTGVLMDWHLPRADCRRDEPVCRCSEKMPIA